MKSRIYLDTNIIYTDKEESLSEIFNNNILKIREFLKKHDLKNVSVYLPEIVLKERVQHKIESIESALRGTNWNLKELKLLGHAKLELKPKNDYLKKLNIVVKEFLSKHKVEIISAPKIESDELVRRAIHKIKPFKGKGVGFKDTMIFLTIVDDALKNNADKYILCTNNLEDFADKVVEEFKEKTGKELIIIPGIIQLEEKLDGIYFIGLKRKERDEIIKNKIYKKIGEIMLEINKRKSSSYSNSDYISLTTRVRDYDTIGFGSYNYQDENKIVGYDFKDISILAIAEKNKTNLKIDVRIETNPRYKDEAPNSYTFTGVNYSSSFGLMSSRQRSKNFFLGISCDLENDELFIHSVDPF